MQVNALPDYDMSTNFTGCCPKFDPEGWDGVDLRFRDKRFVKAKTKSVDHVPVDMDEVFTRVFDHMEDVGAMNPDDFIVLSRDLSPTEGEHLFAASKPVPGETMVRLSGIYLTGIFEGPYDQGPHWQAEMERRVRDRGSEPGKIYFFYTTCPRCAEEYGKNYVVCVAEIA